MLDESNSRSKDGDFSMIDMLHHFTSGFKTICAKFVYEGVDELRQACGGAGYLLSSGIGFNW
jgi:hypothetical protein